MHSINRLLHKDKIINGLSFNDSEICLTTINEKNEIYIYKTIDLDPEKFNLDFIKNNNYIFEKLNQLLNEKPNIVLRSNHLAISIPNSQVKFGSINLDSLTSNNYQNIKKEVSLKLKKSIDDFELDYQIIQNDDNRQKIFYYLVSKKIIGKYLEIMEKLNFKILVIEPSILSIQRVLRITEQSSIPSIILDIRLNNSSIAVMNQNLMYIKEIPIGGNNFTYSIMKYFSISLEEANQFKIIEGLNSGPDRQRILEATESNLKGLSVYLKEIIKQINKSMPNNKSIEQILISGTGSNFASIGDYLTNDLVMPVRVVNPWHKFKFINDKNLHQSLMNRYVSSVGLSLITPKEIFDD